MFDVKIHISDKLQYIEKEIIDQYLYDENEIRPWIVGFSGGKDSTAILQLIWNALLKIKESQRKRNIHVVCNDTLVENPIIEQYVNDVLFKIQKEATIQGLPIFVHKTSPKLEDTFWVNLVGRGYPAPTHSFRWCTDRLKIEPTSQYIKSFIKGRQQAIVVLGARSAESSNRARTIERHELKGERLSYHPTLKNVYVYLPIKKLENEEVWYYINTVPSPWNADNEVLFNIYADASSEEYECPVMSSDKNTPSCGKGRFGCWVCTVVEKDKSITALIKNGNDWLKPLLEVRNSIYAERNRPENRTNFRRNGQLTLSKGSYNFAYRAKILEQVLLAQKQINTTHPHINLISQQELVAIQIQWYRDTFYNVKVADIYNKIFPKEVNMRNNIEKKQLEENLLKEIVADTPKHFNLVKDLLHIQKTKDFMIKKAGLKRELELRIDTFLKTEN